MSIHDEARQQRRLAIRNRSRSHWLILAGIIGGVVIAGVLVVTLELDSDVAMSLSTLGGVALGTGSAAMIGYFGKEASCPQCGCQWDYVDGPDNPKKWRTCPQCGLDISDKRVE